MDSGAEVVITAEQHDRSRFARPRVRVSITESQALPGAHRAVVELEPQVTNPRVLLVADLAIGVIRRRPTVERDANVGHVRLDAGEFERKRGRQLEISLGRSVMLFELRDPHRTIGRGPADGAVTPGDEFSWRPVHA